MEIRFCKDCEHNDLPKITEECAECKNKSSWSEKAIDKECDDAKKRIKVKNCSTCLFKIYPCSQRCNYCGLENHYKNWEEDK